ncbi:MAG: ATP-binding protein [Methanomassiliicoccaceae archaeon]|nr:ATP-binding protein [Methanomassiliicoccaceae archaeon]
MERLIARDVYTDRIRGFIDKEPIKIITGVRRSGKSGILGLVREEVMKSADEGHIISINFEDSEFDDIVSYKELNRYVAGRMEDGGRYYLFLDEIQDVRHWEKAVNSLRLKNTDIYVTGSNSRLLSGEMATLLAGRYVSFEVGTLSFEEFVRFREGSGLSGEPGRYRYGLLDDYIRTGGFPMLSTVGFTEEQARQVVSDIQSSIVLKDVVSRYKVKNAPLLRKIVSFIYDNVGSFVSIRKIADHLKSNGGGGDFDTVSRYVGYLEDAYAIKRVGKYDIRGRRLLDCNDKFYLADHSLLYAVRDMKRANIPGILENIVHNDLVRRGYTVYAGSIGTKEVDFVAERINSGEKVYVQVCMEYGSAETMDREFSSLEAVRDHYPKYVVTTDTYWQENRNGVMGIHLNDFLLKKSL